MATAKVIIAGQNNIGPAVKSAQGDISSLTNVAQKAGDTLKKAFTVTAILAALKKLGDGCAACFNSFWEAERKYKQLQIALGNTSAYNQAVTTIKNLSRQTLSSKSDIESMVSELAALGKSSDEIEKISSAAVYLSNVTGKDLNSSMTTLLGTYNGTTTQLRKLGIDVSDLTKEQLAQGAAVDTVISKLKVYSDQLAEIDTRQHVNNIKNAWGDIKQSIGDLVNFSFAPMIARFDNAISSFRDKFNTFIQNVKITISNFPEFISKLGETVKSMLGKFFSFDNISKVFSFIGDYIVTSIKNTITNISNLLDLFLNAIPDTIRTIADGIFNYLMYILTSYCDKVGFNISDLVNKIGTWLVDSPVGKIVDKVISTVVNGLKLIGTIIRNIPQIVRIVVTHIGGMISEFIKGFPQGITNTFKGIGQTILGGILKIKNNFLQSVEDALNSIGEWIQSTWVGKAMKWMGLDLGGKLANIDFGIDRSSQYMHEDRASYYFDKAGEAWSGVKEVGAEMVQQINELLSPKIEQWAADSSTTIGEKLATWTAKSSDEYFEAAKTSFSSIGSFLKDWGTQAFGDLKDGWSEKWEKISSSFENVFGEDVSGFVTWFQGFLTDHAEDVTTAVTPVLDAVEDVEEAVENSTRTFLQSLGDKLGSLASKITGATGEQSSSFGSSVIASLTSNLGQAGEVAGKLAQNMATMGPLLGAIATALEYIFQGLSETLGPILNEFVRFGIEPLKELGRVIGDILMPILDDVMPLVRDVADFLMGLFRIVGIVLKPIIEVLSSSLSPVMSLISNILEALAPVLKVFAKIFVTVTGTIQYVIQTLQHWVASLMNWLAGLDLLGWQPFAGLRMTDPGSPGNYASFIKAKWASIDAAFEQNTSPSTVSASTTTAISSAGYQGATHVTINIYQEAPVVGDAGMRQFARMIRSEFDQMAYFGSTV